MGPQRTLGGSHPLFGLGPSDADFAGEGGLICSSRGLLLPLCSTLPRQIAAICKEFGLPSAGGLVVYLEGGGRISEEAWTLLWGALFAPDPPSRSRSARRDNFEDTTDPSHSAAAHPSPASYSSWATSPHSPQLFRPHRPSLLAVHSALIAATTPRSFPSTAQRPLSASSSLILTLDQQGAGSGMLRGSRPRPAVPPHRPALLVFASPPSSKPAPPSTTGARMLPRRAPAHTHSAPPLLPCP